MAKRYAGIALIGAGTVLTVDEVKTCHAAGSQPIVSPNTNADVVRAAVGHGMVSALGCLTPTEAFAALEAGAHAVKLFPGEMLTLGRVKAMRTVLPKAATVLVVGGVTPATVPAFRQASQWFWYRRRAVPPRRCGGTGARKCPRVCRCLPGNLNSPVFACNLCIRLAVSHKSCLPPCFPTNGHNA
jgi:KDPG and KHG aldolase